MMLYFLALSLVGAVSGLGHRQCPQRMLQNTSSICKIEDWTLYYVYNKDTGECVEQKACEPNLQGNDIFTKKEDCLEACYDLVKDPCIFAHYANFNTCPYGEKAWRYSYNKTSRKCVGFMGSTCYDGSINLFYTERKCQQKCKNK
ncbi:hypothetical protein V5799_010850 [Amblyomma americanum]|uniref:BPTI/Kunitz inhibitor domain-containing protein n=1 Tax=Amblyomma americanum TaxID=6943 RepID=A0AAQ4EJ08_AMBAM